MNNLPERKDPRTLRASDSDRDRVAELIRDAAGEGRLSLSEVDERLEGIYAAKTYAELEKFTDDLPDHLQATGHPAPRSGIAQASGRIGGVPGSKVSIAVMSGVSRKRQWVVPPKHTAIAFWGGVELDLREARFAERETSLYLVAIMGGIEVTVPDDVDVIVDGVGIMGGFEDSTHSEIPTPGSGRPLIRIHGFAFWGGVEVKRKPRAVDRKSHKQIEE